MFILKNLQEQNVRKFEGGLGLAIAGVVVVLVAAFFMIFLLWLDRENLAAKKAAEEARRQAEIQQKQEEIRRQHEEYRQQRELQRQREERQRIQEEKKFQQSQPPQGVLIYQLEIEAPKEGDEWVAGTTQIIEWNLQPKPTGGYFKLSYIDALQNRTISINENIPHTMNKMAWGVPDNPQRNARILIAYHDATGKLRAMRNVGFNIIVAGGLR